ncbi:hypothetical protein HYW11_01005 [Candidatus Peregrinibacteria bacterium]|nr:hypothetical protein [Candidatus Peregrinibacteria bacterium]
MPSYPIILSIPMPETWTLTPTASSKRELYDLMFMLRGSTCRVSPYEHRGGVRGVFDLIIDGLTDRERQEILERMKRVGLRRITEGKHMNSRKLHLKHHEHGKHADAMAAPETTDTRDSADAGISRSF